MAISRDLIGHSANHSNCSLKKPLGCFHIPFLASAWSQRDCHPGRLPGTDTTTFHALSRKFRPHTRISLLVHIAFNEGLSAHRCLHRAHFCHPARWDHRCRRAK
jgi:hypothetical protein